MSKIITEITPLSEKDCFYLIDRYKRSFDYPIHSHAEIELNFVSGCTGCRRVVGDSIETLGDSDLVMIGGGLEHVWVDGDQPLDHDMREITIQFSPALFGDTFLQKSQMSSLRDLLLRARNGLAFRVTELSKVTSKIEDLTVAQPGFMRVLKFVEILYDLSVTPAYRQLSTSSFAKTRVNSDSRRVHKVKEYISKHYIDRLSLEQLADMAGMTPTAFSRFFKMRTGRTLSDYLIDVRIGHAARMLVDTTMTSSEICYACGFNNISNFNRLFKKKKGCSPKSFRENYLKTKIIV